MPEVRLTAPVKALRVDDLFVDGTPPGAFKFWVYGTEPADAPPAGLHFLCPCGCGAMYGATFRLLSGGAGWSWDGNREAPTVTPSLGCHPSNGEPGFHWHGFLTAGQFVQA